jgi:hypothetical protein
MLVSCTDGVQHSTTFVCLVITHKKSFISLSNSNRLVFVTGTDYFL